MNPDTPKDQPHQLSACHNAPVVLCEGAAWDVTPESIRPGSTYCYGCTECHEACDLAAHSSQAKEELHPMSGGAMAISILESLPNSAAQPQGDELDAILEELHNAWLDDDYDPNDQSAVEAKTALQQHVAQQIQAARLDENNILAIFLSYERYTDPYRKEYAEGRSDQLDRIIRYNWDRETALKAQLQKGQE